MVWFWLMLAIALVVVELATTQIISIWFGVGAAFTAMITAIVKSCGGNLPLVWQLVIFVIVSCVLLASTRKLVKRLMKRSKEQETNLELNIDKIAVVTEKIDNLRGEGAVKINGLEWTARSLDDTIIEKDELVIFKEIKGNKAYVIKKGE